MTKLDQRIPGRVETLINKFGVDAIFSVETATYNPVTRKYEGGTTQNILVKVTPRSNDRTKWGETNLSNLQYSTVVLAARGLTFTPALGMKVTIDSKSYKIVDVQTISSGALAAAYKVRLR